MVENGTLTEISRTGGIALGFIIVIAAMMLYLASPHQQLVLRALPRRTLAAIGVLALLLALALLRQYAGSATSVFILLTAISLCWTLAPPLLACFRASQRRSR